MTQNTIKIRYDRQTAEHMFSRGQAVIVTVLAILLLTGMVFATRNTLIAVLSITTAFLFAKTVSVVVMNYASRGYRFKTVFDRTLEYDEDLPTFSIFVPLYRELEVLPTLIRALESIRYPREKLRIYFGIDEGDPTHDALVLMGLSDEYEIVTVPSGGPKGKPQALNMMLARATGTFSVIYDAEDRPDPHQLLKAVQKFRLSGAQLGCVQGKLYFYNHEKSVVSLFYAVEYYVHYELVLPGLERLGFIPPLGGTSNLFRTDALRRIAIHPDLLPEGELAGIGGWDPFNKTEDAELAGALAVAGYTVAMIDSYTREAAPIKLGVAADQRVRWIKGYLQTGLVYLRNPIQNARKMGPLRWAVYVLTVLGTPVSMLLMPIFFGMTALYWLARAGAYGPASTGAAEFVEGLFPLPLYYAGVAMLVAGNLFLFYQLVDACIDRGYYKGVKWMILAPLWWLATSWSAYRALVEIIVPSLRDKWSHTPHPAEEDTEQVEAEDQLIVRSGVTIR